jgi:hypothetical protein
MSWVELMKLPDPPTEAATLAADPATFYDQHQIAFGYMTSKDLAQFLLAVHRQYLTELNLRPDLSGAERRRRFEEFFDYSGARLHEDVKRVQAIYDSAVAGRDAKYWTSR